MSGSDRRRLDAEHEMAIELAKKLAAATGMKLSIEDAGRRSAAKRIVCMLTRRNELRTRAILLSCGNGARKAESRYLFQDAKMDSAPICCQ